MRSQAIAFSKTDMFCLLNNNKLLKAVAKKLHKVDVDVKLLHSSQDSEHGEFLIQEKNKPKHHEDTIADDIDMILSNGLLFQK